jgi:hypothetical protein
MLTRKGKWDGIRDRIDVERRDGSDTGAEPCLGA